MTRRAPTQTRDKSHMGREIAAQRDMLLAALQNLHREVNLAAGSNPKVAAALKAARRIIDKTTGAAS